MSAYKCNYDPTCLPEEMRTPDKKNETEDAREVHESDISSNETMEKKFNIIFFEDLGGGKDLENMIVHIDSGLQQSPEFLRSLFGNEKMNIYADDTKMFLATLEGRVVEAGEGELADQSMNIYTNQETLDQLKDGTLDFIQAIEEDKIHYEGEGLINFLKFTIIDFLSNFFMPQPTDVAQ